MVKPCPICGKPIDDPLNGQTLFGKPIEVPCTDCFGKAMARKRNNDGGTAEQGTVLEGRLGGEYTCD
jgi:hypothetical protein